MKKQALNPYLPNYEYIPDGEPYVFGERVYIFGSHDRFNGNDFCMNDYVCWSAPVTDLSDWKYEGIIFRKTQDMRMPNPQNGRLFAPDVVKGVDGRFYLYYAFDFSGTIGVAVCDSPAGEYQYYGHVKYPDGTIFGEKEDDRFQYDPGLLADHDGKIYLYTGFCITGEAKRRFQLPKPIAEGAMVTELEQDMITIKREPTIMIPNCEHSRDTCFEGHAFFEAASIRKVEDKYYFIYSSEHGHELCYAISDYPDKEFIYGGTLVSNGDIFYEGRTEPLNYTGTNHGSIEKIGNAWYVFYHRQTNGNPYSRQGCAEKITILPSGFIPQVEMTSCGMNGEFLKGIGGYSTSIACCLMSKDGAAPYLPKKHIPEGHPYFTQDGEDREDCPGQYIANMRKGSLAGFKYFSMEELGEISAVTRGNGNGELQVMTELIGKPVASIPITASKDWIESLSECKIEQGITALWFRFDGDGAIDFASFILKKKGSL